MNLNLNLNFSIELLVLITAVAVLFIISVTLRCLEFADRRRARRNNIERLSDSTRLNTDLKSKARFNKALGMLVKSEYVRRGTFRKAARIFIKIASRTPDPLDKSYCLDWAARCYEDCGDIALAGLLYTASIDISPSDDFASKRLGDYYSENVPEESVKHYERALEYSPLSSVTYYKLAKVHSKLGETDKAVTRFQTAIDTNNGYVAPMAEAAIESAKMGNKTNLLKFYFLAMANDVSEFEKLEEELEQCLT